MSNLVRCPDCAGKGHTEGPQWNQTDRCKRCDGVGAVDAEPAESVHQHHFENDGIRYTHDDWPMAGTGAHRRYYWRLYFCPACMERRAERLDYTGDSYSKVQFDAQPPSAAEKAVMR